MTQVVGYYRTVGAQRLVITGAPGFGKTVLAMELILGLLDGRADDDPVRAPLPPCRSWPAAIAGASANRSFKGDSSGCASRRIAEEHTLATAPSMPPAS